MKKTWLEPALEEIISNNHTGADSVAMSNQSNLNMKQQKAKDLHLASRDHDTSNAEPRKIKKTSSEN